MTDQGAPRPQAAGEEEVPPHPSRSQKNEPERLLRCRFQPAPFVLIPETSLEIRND